MQDVTNVRKRKNCGFPNSIEVLWRGGKREFFTSFLSREDAYRLIMIAWHQNRCCRPMQTLDAAQSIAVQDFQSVGRAWACGLPLP
jgi:hypothetical protein